MKNEQFLAHMKDLLGSRYDAFSAAYENKPRHKALRVNTNKISVDEFKRLFGGELTVNPLCANSFYCDVKPSKDPLYHAGLYYMQEPSAAAAVAAFAPFAGERVLDLCAAPGGKSTQLSEYIKGGVLFCNDSENSRVSALIENIERLGVRNAVVTCATAADYRAAGFDGYFDTLVVDAPCSGGGMTRYERVPYSRDIVNGCAARQRDILKDAVELLCRGGYMLYSTCTFSREENEENVEYLISHGFATVNIPLLQGAERGINMSDARRVYPMNFDGEGHFFCVLQKTRGVERVDMRCEKLKRVVCKFGNLTFDADGGDNACRLRDFALPCLPPRINGRVPLGYSRVGVPVYADDARGNRRELDHALSHALTKAETEKFGTIELGDTAYDYIAGKQLDIAAPKGKLIMTYKGYALGFGTSSPDGGGAPVIKNNYPKKLRIKST